MKKRKIRVEFIYIFTYLFLSIVHYLFILFIYCSNDSVVSSFRLVSTNIVVVTTELRMLWMLTTVA